MGKCLTHCLFDSSACSANYALCTEMFYTASVLYFSFYGSGSGMDLMRNLATFSLHLIFKIETFVTKETANPLRKRQI